MSKVTHIRGGPVAAPGEPVPSVVETLRDLLAKAESGEIVGLAGVAHHGDRSITAFDRGDTNYDAVKGALFGVTVNL